MRTIVILMLLLLVVAACKPGADEQNKTKAGVIDIDDVGDVKEDAKKNDTATTIEVVEDAKKEKPMGAMIAVLTVSNADQLDDIKSLTFRTSKVLLEADDVNVAGRFHSVGSSTVEAEVVSLGDEGVELGINSVRAQKYKLIEWRVKDDGVATTSAKDTTFSVPFDDLQIRQPFEMEEEDVLTLVINMDLAASITQLDDAIMVRPKITATLLRDADVQRKAGGKVVVTAGEEIFSVTREFNDLIPPEDLEKAVNECKNDCEDSCSIVESGCMDECRNDVETGCALGGNDCREKCDSYIVKVSPAACRDNCEDETETTCTKNLQGLCQNACQRSDVDACTMQCQAAC